MMKQPHFPLWLPLILIYIAKLLRCFRYLQFRMRVYFKSTKVIIISCGTESLKYSVALSFVPSLSKKSFLWRRIFFIPLDTCSSYLFLIIIIFGLCALLLLLFFFFWRISLVHYCNLRRRRIIVI